MKFLIRLLERIIILIISALVLWFIVTQIFKRLDQILPMFLSLMATYLISAYIFLPRVVKIILLISKKGRIPRFNRSGDGFHVDPVNIILIGTKDQLKNVFNQIGWHQADKINIKSCLKMINASVKNKPYPRAPFSNLYLFGRRQDIGFQEPIGNSPRKRHHIRFWGTNVNKIDDPLDIKFWTKKQKIDLSKVTVWIGSGSEDLGLTLTRFTYQLSHKVNPNVDRERKYILATLKKNKCIGNVNYYKPGTFTVGKYTSDGRIAVAKLKKLDY